MTSDLTFISIDLEQHYPLIAGWWAKHQWAIIPKECLPQTGLIAVQGETPLAAAFLYRTDSAMGWLEFMVTNPDANPITRARGLKEVIKRLSSEAPHLGIKCLFSSTVNDGLVKILKGADFTVGDTNTTQLVRTSWQ